MKKYVLYAIGEILLVMIGILLALQVNTWNENRKSQKLIQRINKTLLDETQSNLQKTERSNTYRLKLVENLRHGRHVIMEKPISALPIDANDDRQLEDMIRKDVAASGQKAENIRIVRVGEKRFLEAGDLRNRMSVTGDTLRLFGDSNIQLRSADISNHTWKLAQASNAIVEMDYDLVDMLGRLDVLHQQYLLTVEKAIQTLYSGDGPILPILEDMLWEEKELLQIYREILAFFAEE